MPGLGQVVVGTRWDRPWNDSAPVVSHFDTALSRLAKSTGQTSPKAFLVMSDGKGFIYLLHFEKALPDGRQHYVGFARNRDHLAERVALHRSGNGAGFTFVMAQQGIGFHVVRLWRGARGWLDERRIKERGARSQCPLCGSLTKRGRDRNHFKRGQ
jgi:hypothetical protein